jgi:hypothetical protein
MNARATLSNGRRVKENGGGMVYIHFWGPSIYNTDGLLCVSKYLNNETCVLIISDYSFGEHGQMNEYEMCGGSRMRKCGKCC